MRDSIALIVMFVISLAAFIFVKYRNKEKYIDPDPKLLKTLASKDNILPLLQKVWNTK